MDTSKEFGGVASAARDFFGDHQNQEIRFLVEWKALSEKDKQEIKEGLQALGYVILK